METLYTEIAKPHAERRMPTRRLPEVNAEAVSVRAARPLRLPLLLLLGTTGGYTASVSV